jgi:plasmid maintenance system antidote protein VapI
MVRILTRRPPTHLDEMLKEEFLTPYKISQSRLAEGTHFRRRGRSAADERSER